VRIDYFFAAGRLLAAFFAGRFLAAFFAAGRFLAAFFAAGRFFAAFFAAGRFLAGAFFFAAGATFPPWDSTLNQFGPRGTSKVFSLQAPH